MGVFGKLMDWIGFQDEERDEEREEAPAAENETYPFERRRNRSNVVSIHSQKNVRLMLCEPRSYDETPDIADHLRAHRPVLVNLHRVRPDQAMRIVDFLSGTVYALSGQISKVGPNIFLCTPENVEIHGAISEDHDDDADTVRLR